MAPHRKDRTSAGFAHDVWRNVMQDGDFRNQNRVLTSWKEIAAYLGKGVRTVQRWEKDFGLPVRRPIHSDKSAILARTHDLDAWIAMRCSTRGLPDGPDGRPHRMLSIRSSLAAGITTAQLLHASNAELLSQVKRALTGLQEQILRMRNGTQRHAPPHDLSPTSTSQPDSPEPQDQPSAGAA